MDFDHLQQRARQVLADNDHGNWTRPAPGLYPHQWLWDSCFIAIGLASVDAPRAARELESTLRGQWSNGMIAHMVYSRRWPERLEAKVWRTGELAPAGVRTSGITQPPMLAVAVELVAEQLTPRARDKFLATMVPALIRYHDWLYRERDPSQVGLVTLIHPWESGMDDTPPWSQALQGLPRIPLELQLLHNFNLIDRAERASDADAQRMAALLGVINDADCDSGELLRSSPVLVRDLAFNAILAAANESLERLAVTAKVVLPADLAQAIPRTRIALERLWSAERGQYHSYDVRRGAHILLPSVATFLPLYAGTASLERAEELRELLVQPGGYGLAHPVPSVPQNHPTFEHRRYWCGPAWINMNWFIIRGLERYDFYEEAEWLRLRTLDVVDRHGFREYFDPLSGEGLGAHEFSWTAALVLDLLSKK